jgi:hypothetical protein
MLFWHYPLRRQILQALPAAGKQKGRSIAPA